MYEPLCDSHRGSFSAASGYSVYFDDGSGYVSGLTIGTTYLLVNAKGYGGSSYSISNGGTLLLQFGCGASVQATDASANASCIIFKATSTTMYFSGSFYSTDGNYGGGWSLVILSK